MSTEGKRRDEPKVSLKQVLEGAAAQARKDPPWLQKIYEQNRQIERAIEARDRNGSGSGVR
jgi:hypothetical protein